VVIEPTLAGFQREDDAWESVLLCSSRGNYI